MCCTEHVLLQRCICHQTCHCVSTAVCSNVPLMIMFYHNNVIADFHIYHNILIISQKLPTSHLTLHNYGVTPNVPTYSKPLSLAYLLNCECIAFLVETGGTSMDFLWKETVLNESGEKVMGIRVNKHECPFRHQQETEWDPTRFRRNLRGLFQVFAWEFIGFYESFSMWKLCVNQLEPNGTH